MMRINIKILLVIIFLFFYSCKEKIKNLTENRTLIDTTSIVKDDTKTRSNKTQTEGECNQNKWIKKYINDLDVTLIEYNENKIGNLDKLLLTNQKFYLGYIGVNKKRLDILFNTIKIDKSDVLKYILKGYTIVNKNKRFFNGFIETEDVYKFKHFLYGVDDIMKGKIKEQGVVIASYYLEEASNLSATGFFKGKCVIKWYIDTKNNLRYDDIEDYSDSYSNNQFIGTWTSYKTNKSQICAWGQLKKNINNVRKVIVKDTINEIKNRIKVIGFFDYDTIKDTIFYSLDNTKNEPIYKCNVFFGNKNTKEFYISTGTGYIQLTNCKKGCIEKSEITTGLFSSEEIEKYLYDEKLNNWFAFETTTKEKDTLINNKIIGEQWSIDDEIIKK